MKRFPVSVILLLALAACGQSPTPATTAKSPQQDATVKPLDTVVLGDVNNGTVTSGDVTKTKNETGKVRLYIVADDNNTDPVNHCNADANNPVTIKLSSNSSVVSVNSPDSVLVYGCGDTNFGEVTYKVAGGAKAGDSAVLTAIASGGRTETKGNRTSSGSFTAGSFKVTVTEPKTTDSTPPIIKSSVTGTLGTNGWYTSNVTVTWSVKDDESQYTSDGCDSSTVSSDTTGTTFTCEATSSGGTSKESVTIKRDATLPTIAYSLSKVANTAGWHKEDVTVTFACADTGGSGVDTCPAPITVSAEGTMNITGTVTDKAGNSASIEPFSVKLDKAPPVITGSRTPIANSHGWNNTDVTVSFACTDARSDIASCTPSTTILNSDGANQSVSGTATDQAGNTTTATVSNINIDKTVPTITYSLNKVANTAGWHKEDVTVTFACADTGGSGVDTCPAPITVSEGNIKITSTVTDKAGNSADITPFNLKVDKTGPSAPTATFMGELLNGWYKNSVSVSYSGSTDPTLADGSAGSGVASHSAAQTFSTTGAHNYSGTAMDNAGNTGAAVTGSINVDATAPTVSYTDCPTTDILFGSSASVSWTASDVDSGLASEARGTQTLDTSSVGPKSVSVTATDNVGLTHTATCNYKVVYAFTGFFQPISMNAVNVVKAGSAVPVKFSLGGDLGLNVMSASSSPIACDTSAPLDTDTPTVAAGNSSLSYDAASGQYTYVWKTEKSWSGCRRLTLTFKDDSVRSVNFKLN